LQLRAPATSSAAATGRRFAWCATRSAATKLVPPVALRHPQSVRPWQHVLDPLAGYLLLAQTMVTESASAPPALNLGPDADCMRSVRELVEALSRHWGGRPGWWPDFDQHPHEDALLSLDASRARAQLGWRPQLAFDEAVAWTADWYRAFWNGEGAGAVTRRQTDAYCERLEHPADERARLRGSA
jgi:CDP-glucose 4,6-dehydratase